MDKNPQMAVLIVHSLQDSGALSVRDLNGRAGGFKTGLVEAGFEAGQIAVLITKEEYVRLCEAATRAGALVL